MADASASREDLIASENARVASIELAPREHTRWHHHSRLTENIFCLVGPIDVETDAGTQRPHSAERCQLNPRQRHQLVNPDTEVRRYLLVQNGRYDFITEAQDATGSLRWRISSP